MNQDQSLITTGKRHAPGRERGHFAGVLKKGATISVPKPIKVSDLRKAKASLANRAKPRKGSDSLANASFTSIVAGVVESASMSHTEANKDDIVTLNVNGEDDLLDYEEEKATGHAPSNLGLDPNLNKDALIPHSAAQIPASPTQAGANGANGQVTQSPSQVSQEPEPTEEDEEAEIARLEAQEAELDRQNAELKKKAERREKLAQLRALTAQ